MSDGYLLDTNVAIRVLNQQVDLEAHRSRDLEVFLSLTVVGELLFGAEKSHEAEKNRAKVDRLVQLCPVLPQDLATARHYAALKAALRRKGRLIPENDFWIAAAAIQHDLILATLDRHFDQVEGLRIDAW